MSPWIRTDNLLLLLTVLRWLVVTQEIPLAYAAVPAAARAASVTFIQHMAGNYGWLVLFRLSFIAGKYPAEIVPCLTIREYFSAFLLGARSFTP